MPSGIITTRRAEFDAHVWNHVDDVFQSSFDLRSPLEQYTLDRLSQLVAAMENGSSDEDLSTLLRQQTQPDPDYLLTVLQLVGLTRNKPVSDLKVPLRESDISTPADVRKFASKPQVWRLAGTYFSMRLRTVFTHLVGLDPKALYASLEALNQSTWPGYIRQERAKRSGGYAEQRFAIALRGLGLPYAPEGKADNGLTADANIAGESFDIVVPDAYRPKLCVISMLHSSNIGQYGESKAGDAQRAKDALRVIPSKPKLAVLVDGVGFHSNIAGLNGLLACADEFFQLATLWKGTILAASATGRKLAVVVPDPAVHADFLHAHSRNITVLNRTDRKPGWIEAGEGLVRPL